MYFIYSCAKKKINSNKLYDDNYNYYYIITNARNGFLN